MRESYEREEHLFEMIRRGETRVMAAIRDALEQMPPDGRQRTPYDPDEIELVLTVLEQGEKLERSGFTLS